jgi:hypothetical protein
VHASFAIALSTRPGLYISVAVMIDDPAAVGMSYVARAHYERWKELGIFSFLYFCDILSDT